MALSGFQTQGHGIDEGVDSGPNVLKVNDEDIYVFKHGLGGHSGFAIEAEDGDIENRVDQILGSDHVVLPFSKKPVLGAKQGLKLARKVTVNQNAAGAQAPVNSSGICQEPQAFSPECPRRFSNESLNAGLDRFHNSIFGFGLDRIFRSGTE